jgi:hypothetical protein
MAHRVFCPCIYTFVLRVRLDTCPERRRTMKNKTTNLEIASKEEKEKKTGKFYGVLGGYVMPAAVIGTAVRTFRTRYSVLGGWCHRLTFIDTQGPASQKT